MTPVEALLELIALHAERLIVHDNEVLGICECAGKGCTVRLPEDDARNHLNGNTCLGAGRVRVREDFDPCGRWNYSSARCPYLKAIPKTEEADGQKILPV
jgi:hypothetical protein